MFVPRRNGLYLRFAAGHFLATALTAWFLPQEGRAQTLPEGPGRDVVQKACSMCHPAALVMGRNLSREEWSAQVTKMVQEGATMTAAEFTQVVNYLARSFPPNPTPPAPAGRGRSGRGGGGEAGPAEMQVIDPVAADRGRLVYIAECVTCHGPKARGAKDGAADSQKGSDLVRSVPVLHDRFGSAIGPFLKKGHPMQSGKPSAGLTGPQIVDLSHFLHQKVADTLR